MLEKPEVDVFFDAAELLLFDYPAFWKVRAAFYKLAFCAEEGGGCAERLEHAGERHVTLKPAIARGLWTVALFEAGDGLTRQRAAALAAMTREQRLEKIASACGELGLTGAGRERLAPFTALEDDAMWSPGLWEWCAAHDIAAAP